MEKKRNEAIDRCMYAIIWEVGAANMTEEKHKNILEALEKLYDAGKEAGERCETTS